MLSYIQSLVKIVSGLEPQAVNNTNVTGHYLHGKGIRRMMAKMTAGPIAAAKTATLAIKQATDVAGTGVKAVSSATATATSGTLEKKSKVALAAVGAGDTVTINSLTYTKAGATAAASREFADAAGLVTCVNDSTYGVDGVFAEASGTDVYLTADEDHTITITRANVGGTITLSTELIEVSVELDVGDLDLANSFDYFAANAATTDSTGNAILGVQWVYLPNDMPEQKVGASATL